MKPRNDKQGMIRDKRTMASSNKHRGSTDSSVYKTDDNAVEETLMTQPCIMSTQQSNVSNRRDSKNRRARVPQQKSFDDELEKQLSSLENSDENEYKTGMQHSKKRRRSKKSLSQARRGENKIKQQKRQQSNQHETEPDDIERNQDDGYINRIVDGTKNKKSRNNANYSVAASVAEMIPGSRNLQYGLGDESLNEHKSHQNKPSNMIRSSVDDNKHSRKSQGSKHGPSERRYKKTSSSRRRRSSYRQKDSKQANHHQEDKEVDYEHVFELKSDEDDIDDVIRRIEKEFITNRNKSVNKKKTREDKKIMHQISAKQQEEDVNRFESSTFDDHL